MFDVPPPHEGVLGIDAYRETWPPFFEWQARGASFEISDSRSDCARRMADGSWPTSTTSFPDTAEAK